MTTIIEFLLARLAEDEEVARAACRVRETRAGDSWTVHRGQYGMDIIYRTNHDVGQVLVETAPHIARWNPLRVLAECEAKRRIVEWHENWPVLVETEPEFTPRLGDGWLESASFVASQRIAWLTSAEYVKRFGDEPPSAPILLMLAQPYADHPDFDPSWRL